jgi:hypothetical protein
MATSDEKYQETITHTNGEMLIVLAALFGLDPDNVFRWAIVITSHVPNEPAGTHDIRVASNCVNEDIPSLLDIGKSAI